MIDTAKSKENLVELFINHKNFQNNGVEIVKFSKNDFKYIPVHISKIISDLSVNEEISSEFEIKKSNITESLKDIQSYSISIDDKKFCPICYIEIDGNKLSFNCDHFFCKNCVKMYLNELIQNSKVILKFFKE